MSTERLSQVPCPRCGQMTQAPGPCTACFAGGLHSTDKWRQQVTPTLAVVVDVSMCIVLEITTTDGSEVLGRATLSYCDRVTDTMELARVFVKASEDDLLSRKRDALAELFRQQRREDRKS